MCIRDRAHRAGVSAGFLGCVGDDMFGNFLRGTLEGCGVETKGLSPVSYTHLDVYKRQGMSPVMISEASWSMPSTAARSAS